MSTGPGDEGRRIGEDGDLVVPLPFPGAQGPAVAAGRGGPRDPRQSRARPTIRRASDAPPSRHPPIPVMVPRICIGWRTIQTPAAKRRTIRTAQGANALQAAGGERAERDPVAGVEREEQAQVEADDLQPGQPVRHGPAARVGSTRAPRGRASPRSRGEPLRRGDRRRRSSSGSESCSAPATCRSRAGPARRRTASPTLQPARRQPAPSPAQDGRAGRRSAAAARSGRAR